MEQTLTAKIRLYPTPEQAKKFKEVTEDYRQVCNLVSQWFFDNHFKTKRKAFNAEMYHVIRHKFPQLNSAMVQSTYRTVEARYKTVATQLKQHPYRYDTGKRDPKTGKAIWKSVPRDLEWLWQPINFKRPQADYLRNTNYSFAKQGTLLSLNVLGQRIKVPFNDQCTQSWFDQKAKLGTAKLVCLKGHWFLHIPVTFDTDDWQIADNQHIVGIDRGLRQVMTIYDEQDKTKFFPGRAIAYKRKKFAYLRAKLQSAGTKSAKRHLKKMAQRENRWMADVNHCLSKTLVNHYGENTLFVLEDLANVSFDEKNQSTRDRNRDLHSWPFYGLQTKLIYKAKSQRSQVLIVSAKYTSQRCPKCGQIRKANRNHALHLYQCKHCGFTTNDDRVGAMNLYDLGKRYLGGEEKPKYTLNNVTD